MREQTAIKLRDFISAAEIAFCHLGRFIGPDFTQTLSHECELLRAELAKEIMKDDQSEDNQFETNLDKEIAKIAKSCSRCHDVFLNDFRLRKVFIDYSDNGSHVCDKSFMAIVCNKCALEIKTFIIQKP